MSQGHRDINGSTICPKCGGSDNYNLCTCKENGIWRKRHGLPEKSFEVEVEEGASFEYPVIMKGKVIYVSITKFSEALSRKEVEELICSLQTLMEDSDRKEKETLQRPEPEWYDGMSDYELMALQHNVIGLSFLETHSPRIARNMRKIPNGLVEYWAIGGIGWQKSADNGETLCTVMTYRLNPDWRTREYGDGK